MDEIAIIDLECDWNGFLLDLAGLIPAHRHTGLCQDIHKAQVSKRLKSEKAMVKLSWVGTKGYFRLFKQQFGTIEDFWGYLNQE